MEYGENVLTGTGEVEMDPNIVSEEAGKLYTELQALIQTHGEGAVESVVPIFVWVLEGLARCKTQLRDKEVEVEQERSEREHLLERYQAERTLRKECQEKYLELDDQIEQERRTVKGREKERRQREKELEKKARQQADQLVALEEQRASLSKELSSLRHTHNKLSHLYQELLDKKKDSERDSSLRTPMRPKHAEFTSNQVLPASGAHIIKRPHSNSLPSGFDGVSANGEKRNDFMDPVSNHFIQEIISSTPELGHFEGYMDSSTPVSRANAKEPGRGELDPSWKDEIGDVEKEEEREEKHKKDGEQEGERQEDEEDEEEGDLELEQRNTDSVFSELSELSHDFVESVDRGARVRGSTDQFEEILAQYEELRTTFELVDTARKTLIWRVVELTDDRFTLRLEVSSLQESVSRLEGRIKEKEEETKRLQTELESCQPEDPDSLGATSAGSFSRSEMARVVMEKNQYKQRLFELQEALRHSEMLRATKVVRLTEDRRLSVWKKRRELYRDIRSHIWGSLGKQQMHGWSTPLANTNEESSEAVPAPKDVPVLVQLRLLDHRDSTAKLNCAVAVPPEISGESTCSVWVVSGPACNSSITVIDPARPNAVLDQFSLPPTAPALCICAVPPVGNTAGTVWIGTQEGSVLVHSASAGRKNCLQSVSFPEGVYSLVYSQGQVVAGLADGTLVFFKHSSAGWNLQSHLAMSLGSYTVQPIRCCLFKSSRLWVGYWNKVHVVDLDSKTTQQTFTVSERGEQQVRFLCAAGSGVWASCRLDPVLRLFDWSTGRPLQELDLSTLVTKALGSGFLELSPLQISSLAVISGRLWVGTGGGALFSIPLSITSEEVSIPYCSAGSAQLCYHGHRQAVRFIIAAPDCLITSPGSSALTPSQLILSGGEGYINFRIGDDANDGSSDLSQITPQRFERSHMIIWRNPSAAVPSCAL
ncbi:C-Jun-amino-terminal kinase-interacting protein 3 [Takifugu flavidus]|uniref:C-Jun-amino-terminal kinase-interacting protein 3 n=1 Tax=Takifugu flavidus TaxID=433684 RepID=A0A5C6PH48_9TELE|nr:C-Jun-amino-terminal kinase-interacting protein 3 [Takifugu flavidus]